MHHRRPGARLPLTFPLTPTLTTDPYQVHEFINNSGLVRGKVLEPSDIEEILETLVSDARLECDKQLTGSNGGGPAACSTRRPFAQHGAQPRRPLHSPAPASQEPL